jgi:hypothetical protein
MLSKADAASSRDNVAPVATFPMRDFRSSIACFRGCSSFLEHDPFGKPVPTFPDYAQLFAPVTCAKAA